MNDLSRGRVHISKEGGPIHIASKWRRHSKEGLYITLCGRLVSINPKSLRTAHAGYRVIKAKQTTCNLCRERFYRETMDGAKAHRLAGIF